MLFIDLEVNRFNNNQKKTQRVKRACLWEEKINGGDRERTVVFPNKLCRTV